jgi:glycosyl transferase family 87
LVEKVVRLFSFALIVIAIPVVIYDAARMWSDFVVYHHTARTLLAGTGPLYGPESGLGWPQYFRYPPLFILLFVPFALLPLPVAAGAWAAIKLVVLYLLVRTLMQRLRFPATGYWFLIPLFACAPLLIQELRNGNVQFLVFALVAFALLSVEEKPWFASAILGFAVILKVWPLFFVPYLLARRQLRVAAATLLVVAVLAIAPALYFGWSGNIDLLRQWAVQEWGTGSLSNAVWYPSQSLAGVLQNYFSKTDRSRWPDPNYPDVQLLSVNPVALRVLWIAVVGASYLGLLWLARNGTKTSSWMEHSLAFAMLPLLQPFAHRIVFVDLLWPMLVVTAMLSRKVFSNRSKFFLYGAVAILVLEPFVPGGHAQRFLQIAGSDFLAACFLATGLTIACLEKRTFNPHPEERQPSMRDPAALLFLH